MKKNRKSKMLETKRIKNPVAKFAFQFNKAQVFKDKTKYQRNTKHKGKEPFLMMLKNIIRKGSFFLAALRVSLIALLFYNNHNGWNKHSPSIVLFL